jgi:hypothetical protein
VLVMQKTVGHMVGAMMTGRGGTEKNAREIATVNGMQTVVYAGPAPLQSLTSRSSRQTCRRGLRRGSGR